MSSPFPEQPRSALSMALKDFASARANPSRRCAAALSAVTLSAVALAGPAFAASFTASTTPFAGANNCSGVIGGGNSATPLAAFAACSTASFSTTAEASSTYGKVGAFASALGGGSANGLASFSDTVRFTSNDPGAVFATVALQLELSGFLTATAGAYDAFDNPTPNATSSIFAELFFNSAQLVFERTLASDRNGTREATFQNGFASVIGDPHAGGLDVILVTQPFFVPLNRDISYALLLQAGASAFGQGSGASSQFAHTFGLPVGRDVFVLPDGVTANAGDYLVSNRFGAGAAVPEPGAWVLILAGFGLAGAALRRRWAAGLA